MERIKGGLWGVVVCALGAAAGALGCGGPVPPSMQSTTDAQRIAAICDAMCDCKGCSESEAQDCVNGGESQQADAAAAGCASLWEDYAICLDEHLVCDAGSPMPGQCASRLADLDLCVEAGKPACDDLRTQVTGYFEECGVGAPEMPATCSGADQQLLECKVACLSPPHSCDAITGVDAEGKKQIDDCLGACEAP